MSWVTNGIEPSEHSGLQPSDWHYKRVASFPGLHAQLLSLAVRKAAGRPGWIYHVMCATPDVMLSLLTSVFVLSPSLFFPWIQFVLFVQFILRVRLLLDQSWLATVCDVSSGTHHMINPSRPSPRFRTASDKSWAWRPGNKANKKELWVEHHLPMCLPSVYLTSLHVTKSPRSSLSAFAYCEQSNTWEQPGIKAELQPSCNPV